MQSVVIDPADYESIQTKKTKFAVLEIKTTTICYWLDYIVSISIFISYSISPFTIKTGGSAYSEMSGSVCTETGGTI